MFAVPSENFWTFFGHFFDIFRTLCRHSLKFFWAVQRFARHKGSATECSASVKHNRIIVAVGPLRGSHATIVTGSRKEALRLCSGFVGYGDQLLSILTNGNTQKGWQKHCDLKKCDWIPPPQSLLLSWGPLGQMATGCCDRILTRGLRQHTKGHTRSMYAKIGEDLRSRKSEFCEDWQACHATFIRTSLKVQFLSSSTVTRKPPILADSFAELLPI